MFLAPQFKHMPLLVMAFLIVSNQSIAQSTDGPRVLVDETIHDFGVIAPHEVCEHVFVVSNQGDEPLHIEKVVASCKCVLPENVTEYIQPGESADVRVSFKGQPDKNRYNQSVTLATNDPNQPELTLKIVGKIAPDISILPNSIRLNRIERGNEIDSFFEVVSTVWEDFNLENIKPSNPALICTAEKFSESQKQSRGVKSGWKVDVTIDASHTNKSFNEDIYFVVVPSDEKIEPKTMRVDVTGSVRGAIRVTGKGVSMAGRLELHRIDTSKDFERTFLLKVSDPEGDLGTISKRITPDFVQVAVEPYRESGTTSLYRLKLKIPAGKLQGAYIGPSAGQMHLEFDHPRIKEFDILIEMLPDNPYKPR